MFFEGQEAECGHGDEEDSDITLLDKVVLRAVAGGKTGVTVLNSLKMGW